jgi:polyhydroxyalkanoate synthesis regulator phasin
LQLDGQDWLLQQFLCSGAQQHVQPQAAGNLFTGEASMVQEELQKAFFTGVGMVVMSRDKVRRIVDRMVEETKISAEDAERLFSELSSSGENGWSSLKDNAKDAVRGILDGLDVARGREFEKMARRLENLEKRVDLLEAMQKGGETAS